MKYFSLQLHKKIATVSIFLLVVCSLVLGVRTLDAAPNYQMNYQGKLTNASGVAVSDGTYNMRFWLLTSPSIATTSAVWTESLTGGDKVQVTNGLFSIMLGSTSPLTGVDFNQTLYLGVEIGGTSTPAWDGEMSPRKILGTVPAAFEAENAETVGGVASTSLLRSDVDDSASGLLTFTGGIISSASSTITNLSTLISTTTMLVINGEQFTDLTGSSLTITNGALGVATSTFFTNSSQFAGWLSDETGTGNVVFNASPTFTGTAQFAGFNATNASSTYASTSVLSLYGALYDGTSSAGTNGMVLQTVGTSTRWVATSSLGFASSDGGSNWVFNGSRLSPSSTVGIGIFASSTIGGGTGTTGLTVAGSATTTGNAYFGGTVGIGTAASASTMLAIRGAGGVNPLLVASSTGSTTLALLTTGDLELPGQLISGGINWTARSAAGNDDSWSSVAYGNGIFVAVGSSGDIVMTSPDGVTWTVRSAAGNDDTWNSVTYGNGIFVAVGSSGDRVMTSPDGINWTVRSATGNNDDWYSVTYGNGLFVATGLFGDRVMTSPDGITWTARSAGGNNDDWYSVTYGNGRFVAVGDSSGSGDSVIYSTDGITWATTTAVGDNDTWNSVTYGNGLFVAVGYFGNRVMTSPDGITWTARSAANDDDGWYGVTYGNGLFVALGESGGDVVMTSPDGINWTTRSAAGDNDLWLAVTYGNGMFVGVGYSGDLVMTSGKTLTSALATNNIFQGGASFLGGPFNIGTTTSTTNAGIANVFNIASTTGTSLFTITSAGNVGIGSTSPSRLLTVNGGGYFAGNLTAASATITYASTTGLTASQANFTNATTSSIYATTLGTNSEYFTDLTGTGLVNSSGVLSVSTSTFFTTSAQFAQWLSDETGTGNVVFSASPTLTGVTTLAYASTTGISGTNSNFTFASSTYASTSVLSLYGSLYDRSSSAGTNGMVLQTTGSGVTWVATSTLGITSPNHYGPTVIVAASNASNTARAQFVADGTDDEVTIQAAIDSLPSTGGTVLLTEGTFNLGTTTYATSSIRLTSGVQLMGQGSSTRLVLQTLSGSVNENSMIHAVNASGVTIRDLHLEGQRAIQGGSVIHKGIYLENTSSSTVENVLVHNVRSEAFHLNNSSLIGNNTLTNNISKGNGSGFFIANTSHNTITNNTSIGDAGNASFYIASSNNNTVSNNRVSNGGSFGFGIESSNNNTISNNVAQDNNFGGFNVEFASNNTFVGNITISDSASASGFSLNTATHNTFTANTVNDNDYGFYLFSNSTNNAFIGNTIQGNNRYGIYLSSSLQNTISANTLEGNGDSGVYSSIYLSDADDNNIIGNTISATGTDALISLADATSERNVIANNVYINSELNDTSFVLDAGTGTRFDDYNRTTLTTATGVGYNLLRIYGSSSIALASTTQLGVGAIEEWGNSTGNRMTLTNAGNLLVGTTTSRALLTVHGSGFFTNSITAASATITYASTTGLTASQANFTNATTSSIYATTLGTNSEYFTDLTGTGLVNSSGVLSISTSTFFTTSAQFAQWLSDETGTGNVVFSASPTFTGTAQFAGFNATNASSTYASTSVLSLYGSLYDRSSSAGTNGMVLQTTGSGVQWVATSTLGITSNNHYGPTVIVAASNASNTARAQFVADGTNDEVEIQAAIDSLPSTGGTVLLTEGTFNVGTTTYATSSIRLTSGVQLMGQGSSTRLVLQVLSGTGNTNNMIHAVNASGITIRDLHLEGQQAMQGASVVHNGIYFDGASSSTIENVIVNNFDDYGIFLFNGTNNALARNTATNNGPYGFFLEYSTNNIFIDNIATGNTYGFIFLNSTNNTLTANTATNNSQHGFYLFAATNNTFTANTATNNTQYGYYVISSTNNNISANTAINNVLTGIYVGFSNNNTIVGNILEGNNQEGIVLNSSTQNTISANTLEGNGDSGAYPSIFLDGATTDDNVVIGNTISATGTDPLIEIDDSAQERNLIANNVYINSELNDTTFVLDVGTGTRFDEYNRTTLTTATEVGYNLFRIYGSSTLALASTTQLGSGAIEEWGNSAGSAMTLTNGGNLGIGTTTPGQKLSIAGGMHLTGGLYDSTYSAGTNGMILQTTGSGVQWVATSTLGISATGDGGSNWLYNGSRLTPSSTVGIGIFASSTIGDGTGTGGLTVAGTATTTNLKVTSLTASRALFTSVDNLLTTSGLSQYLIDSITDETGTGSLVFSASPTFTGTAVLANYTASNGTTTNASSTNLFATNFRATFASSTNASTTGLTAQNAWIGNALTIGTSTNSGMLDSATLAIWGSGTNNPFSIASSSGSTILALLTTGDLALPGQLISGGLNWTAPSAAGDNDNWNAITYGNGLFVAVGTSTTGGTGVMTSPDGINWTARSAAGDNDYWSSITYGNGLFVAVGSIGNDRVMTSPDGINWTARSATGNNDSWYEVTYGNGLFVAVGDSTGSGDSVMTSPDGINWTARSAAGDNDFWNSVTYGNGRFVAVGFGSEPAMYSTDGINWATTTAAGDNDYWSSITYGNGLFVAVGDPTYPGDTIMTSPDGTTWTPRSAAGDEDVWISVTYGDGIFVAVAQIASGIDSTIIYSKDGINWSTSSPIQASAFWNAITYGNGRFVAVGYSGTHRVMTSGKTLTSELATNNIFQGGASFLSGPFNIGTTTSTTNTAINNVLNIASTTGTSLFTITSAGNVGIGSTSPSRLLTVNGGGYFAGNLTAASATITYASTTGLTASQANFTNATTSSIYATTLGTNSEYFTDLTGTGLVNSSGVLSVSTSTFFTTSAQFAQWLSDETGTGNVVFSASPTFTGVTTLAYASTTGISGTNANFTFASSTNASTTSFTTQSAWLGVMVANTAIATNMLASYASTTNASTTGFSGQRAYLGGFLNIGTTTSQALLTLDRSALTGSVIGGMKQSLNFTNSTLDAVYFGNESYITNIPTATSTLVGSMLRIADTSALGNTVRAFEGQAHRGTNTKGENTGLSGFGRTFGVRGTTLGDAGDTYLPAGVFAETEGTTQGNALRAYSGTITTEDLVSLFHDTSAFTGTGLQMNFGNAGGSFAGTSTAKFLDFQIAGTSKFTVTAGGTTTIGDGTTGTKAGLQIGYGGLCVDNDGSCFASTTGLITSVTSATGNSDLAEIYFSSQSLHAGEIVSLAGGLSIKRADQEDGDEVIGVVSTKPGLLLGFDDSSLIAGENSYPVGLKGRVPVKLSTENGPIKKGDKITLSSIPGVGMKAVESSKVVGVAMEDFDGEYAYSEGFLNQFGDDMVKERLAPRSVENDIRAQDGCYYGGGNALGEKGCVEKEVVVEEVATTTKDTAREDALRELRKEPALDMEDADGDEVAIGQIIMFIELEWYQSDREVLVLKELTATSTLGENEETLWDRIKLLAQNFVDGVLTLTGIKADRIEVQEELCVDGVCVTASDLRALLNSVHDGDDNAREESEGGGEEVVPPPPVEEEVSEEPVEEPPLTEPTAPPVEEEITEEIPVVEEPVVEEIVEEEEPTVEPEAEQEPEPTPEPEPQPTE